VDHVELKLLTSFAVGELGLANRVGMTPSTGRCAR